MTLRAGDMRHRVTFEVRSETRTESGELDYSWDDVATVWSSVEPLTGREFFDAQQRSAKVSTRFRLRYLAGITPGMRIIWQGRWFDIVSVQQIRGIKHELVVMADERVEVPTT